MRRKGNLGISVQLSFAIANHLMGQNLDALEFSKMMVSLHFMASFCFPFAGTLVMLFCIIRVIMTGRRDVP